MNNPLFDLSVLANLCTPDGFSSGGALGLYGALALAGLTGSAFHCGPMCGAFVLGQASRRMAAIPADRMSEGQRLRCAALPGYHFGRIATYTGLGALAGGLGAVLPGWLLGGVMLLAALAFLAMALEKWLGPGFSILGSQRKTGLWLGAFSTLVGPLLARPFGLKGLGIGLILGFLPCGLVHAALGVAIATGKPLAGALAMASFGLGTVPMLLMLGVLGQIAALRFGAALRGAMPVLLLINAVLVGGLGLRALLA